MEADCLRRGYACDYSLYLVGYYTTRQPDGVHLSAHCNYGEKLEGVGHDESAARGTLWTVFRKHTRGKNTIGQAKT
jgi:hypothetical protein